MRSMRVKMELEVDRIAEETSGSQAAMIEGNLAKKAQNDRLIHDNLLEQNESLKRRLEARRNMSFMRSVTYNGDDSRLMKYSNTMGAIDQQTDDYDTSSSRF